VKIYGRSKMAPDLLLTMDEVTFLAGPEQLRSLAQFFLAQADKQASWQGRDHEHYLDTPGAMVGDHEVIVADPKYWPR